MLGLPNCLDTASNAPFMLAWAIVLRVLYRNRSERLFRDQREIWPCRLFFLGAVLIGFGSGYYHLDPDNERFLWDRLEIMLTFMAWFAAIVAERVSLRSPCAVRPARVDSVCFQACLS
jgi:hypothetical protein